MRTLFSIALFFLAVSIWGQEVINLRNPSFEGKPGAGITPSFWKNIGADQESPTDIQPGFFGVNTRPHHGETFVSMVVRGNSTWEGIGQQLKGGKLMKDSVYAFSLWLARPTEFAAMSRITMEEAYYTRAVVLRVWGYNNATKTEELLAETDPVTHTKWMRYDFILKPSKSDFDEIQLIAYYDDDKAPYNGSVLVDDCSEIVRQ